MNGSPETSLVAGATGVAGAAISAYLGKNTAGPVLALSTGGRVEPELKDRVTGVAADLMQPESLCSALSDRRVTHVYYAAHRHPHLGGRSGRETRHVDNLNVPLMQSALRWTRPFSPVLAGTPILRDIYFRELAKRAGLYDPENLNLTMFRNLLDVLAAGKHPVRHVAIVTGGRHYGVHLGPSLYPDWKLPLTETTPRHPGPNWYFGVEDELTGRAGKEGWTWSVHRPHFIIGWAEGAPLSFGNAVAVYAHLLREHNLPLIFPGGSATYRSQWEASDAGLIAAQMHWAAGNPGGHNQAFNVTNGSPFRWTTLWPQIAGYFGMEAICPEKATNVEKLLVEPEKTWKDLVARHSLSVPELGRIFPMHFLNQAMVSGWDVEYSTAKARTAGFTQTVDNFGMFERLFRDLEERMVVPPRNP